MVPHVVVWSQIEPDPREPAMDAVQLTQWKHDPEVRDVPQPDPGPGEVLLKVGGAGM